MPPHNDRLSEALGVYHCMACDQLIDQSGNDRIEMMLRIGGDKFELHHVGNAYYMHDITRGQQQDNYHIAWKLGK